MTRGPITIDSARHRVLVGGKPIVLLTAVEFKLLSMLMWRPGRGAGARSFAQRSLGLRKAQSTPAPSIPMCADCARNSAKLPASSRRCAVSATGCASNREKHGLVRFRARAHGLGLRLVAGLAQLDSSLPRTGANPRGNERGADAAHLSHRRQRPGRVGSPSHSSNSPCAREHCAPRCRKGSLASKPSSVPWPMVWSSRTETGAFA